MARAEVKVKRRDFIMVGVSAVELGGTKSGVVAKLKPKGLDPSEATPEDLERGVMALRGVVALEVLEGGVAMAL